MRIVCLSDTHSLHDRLIVPDGDLLVHAGDFTKMGREPEVRAFDDWLATLPHRHKVVIAGNHDWLFERDPAKAKAILRHATYLLDTGTTVEGLRVWGSPWQPWFYDWAFNLRRGPEIAAKWALVPDGTDILLTHGPPAGIRDRTAGGDDAGCADLLRELDRIRPRLHVFGHIHEGYGRTDAPSRISVNASNCDLAYRPVNPPVVVDL